MNNRMGWVRIAADDLSEFHRELIKAIPKYASIAVSEMMLPASREVLPIEERALLPKCADCKVGKCEDEVPDRAHKEIGYYVLGAALEESPAYRQLRDKLASKPGFRHVQPLQTAKPWSSPLLTLAGAEGEAGKYLAFQPQRYFRVEHIDISDSLGGEGTEVQYIMVGCRIQTVLPFTELTRGMRTAEAMRQLAAFNENNNPVLHHLDTCDSALSIGIMINFLKNCEFRMILKGKAI